MKCQQIVKAWDAKQGVDKKGNIKLVSTTCNLEMTDIISEGGTVIGFSCKAGHSVSSSRTFNPCKTCGGVKGHQIGCQTNHHLTEYQEWTLQQATILPNTDPASSTVMDSAGPTVKKRAKKVSK